MELRAEEVPECGQGGWDLFHVSSSSLSLSLSLSLLLFLSLVLSLSLSLSPSLLLSLSLSLSLSITHTHSLSPDESDSGMELRAEEVPEWGAGGRKVTAAYIVPCGGVKPQTLDPEP